MQLHKRQEKQIRKQLELQIKESNSIVNEKEINSLILLVFSLVLLYFYIGELSLFLIVLIFSSLLFTLNQIKRDTFFAFSANISFIAMTLKNRQWRKQDCDTGDNIDA